VFVRRDKPTQHELPSSNSGAAAQAAQWSGRWGPLLLALRSESVPRALTRPPHPAAGPRRIRTQLTGSPGSLPDTPGLRDRSYQAIVHIQPGYPT